MLNGVMVDQDVHGIDAMKTGGVPAEFYAKRQVFEQVPGLCSPQNTDAALDCTLAQFMHNAGGVRKHA